MGDASVETRAAELGRTGLPHNLIYKVDRGDHFAAWQEPDFFTTGAG